MAGATHPARPRTVLLTRPRAQAEAFGARLTPLGWTPIIAPLQAISFAESPPPLLDEARALLFTSQNGVAAFARLCPSRDLPALCVGPNTAKAARDAGFVALEGPGQAQGLAPWAAQHSRGPVLHCRGAHSTGDLVSDFAAEGVLLHSHTLYTQTALPLEAHARDALNSGRVGVLMVFSPRSAQLLGQATAGIATALPLTLCLSQAVANALNFQAAPEILIAEQPNGDSMLVALQTVY